MQTKKFTIDLSEKTLVDITLVYVKTGKPKYLYLEGSIQPEIKKPSGVKQVKTGLGKSATKSFRLLLSSVWFNQLLKLPSQNFRVYTHQGNRCVHSNTKRYHPQDRVEGSNTKEGKPVTRVEVKDRTTYAGYLLTNTQSQQVASASPHAFSHPKGNGTKSLQLIQCSTEAMCGSFVAPLALGELFVPQWNKQAQTSRQGSHGESTDRE